MSIMTDVAVRASLEDFTKARDETLRLLEQGRRLCDMARECSEKHVRYGFPHEAMPRISMEQATKEIDARWWRHCFSYTGLMTILDAQATREFNESLDKSPPPFTMETIEAMVLEMYQKKDELFLRGVHHAFRKLDSSYRSNDKQRFEVGRRSVITYLFDTWYSGRREFRINYRERGWINDLHRCICLLMDEPYQEHALEAAIHEQTLEGNVFENDYIRLKGFKNGNGHLYILDEELRLKINRCIAEYCGPSIPDDRVNNPTAAEACNA
jgi:hypothetical protein